LRLQIKIYLFQGLD